MIKYLQDLLKTEVTLTYGFLVGIVIGWFISTSGRAALIEYLGKMPEYYGAAGIVVWATVIVSFVFRFKFQNLFYASLINYAFFHAAVIWELYPPAGIYAAVLYVMFFISEVLGKTEFSNYAADKVKSYWSLK